MIGMSAMLQSLRKVRRCSSTRGTSVSPESCESWWTGTLDRTWLNRRWATWLTSSSSPKTSQSTRYSMCCSYCHTRRVDSPVNILQNLPQLKSKERRSTRWRRCWSHDGMGGGRNCNTSCTGRVGAPNTTVGRMQ